MAQAPGEEPTTNFIVRTWAWTIGTWFGRIVGLVLLLALIISLYWWPESGFDQYQDKDNFQRARTLWDWLGLLGLLGVPLVLAVGGFAFSRAERKNEQEIAVRRSQEEQKRAEKRADLERELADKRATEERARADDALRQALVQDYVNHMSDLLLDRNLASSQPDNLVREAARAQTFTVLRGLGEDGARKGYIVSFLYGAGLINKGKPIVDLRDADFGGANLTYVTLIDAYLVQGNLSRASLMHANLKGANLSDANLQQINSQHANLHKANLRGAHLFRANLQNADLVGADLSLVNLCGADLSEADFTGADFTGARLNKADLSRSEFFGANFTDAGFTGAIVEWDQLSQAASLEGATMPNGSGYSAPPAAVESQAPPPDSPDASRQSNSAT